MKIRKLIYLSFAVTFFAVIASPSLASAVDSSTLIEQSKKYNNKRVEFSGEVIGDVMIRGDFAWINVNDDPYSKGQKGNWGYNSGQSIWVASEMAKKIKRTGGYFWQGDRIKVKGIFNRICRIHGGDMDIHASSLEIISRGKPIKRSISISKVITSVILFSLVVLVYLINNFIKQKRLAEI